MAVPIFALKKFVLNDSGPEKHKYYAAVRASGEDTLEDITRKIAAVSTVSSKAEDDPRKISVRCVRKARLVYYPDKRLKNWLEGLKFRKIKV